MASRRAVLGAAWALPVISAAVAVPVAAASSIGERIRFTNLTATVGKEPGTVYVNTRVQVVDGMPVDGLTVSFRFEQRDGPFSGTHVVTYTDEPTLPGWGATSVIRVEQSGFTTGPPVTVTFIASADGCETITGSVIVDAPAWWNNERKQG